MNTTRLLLRIGAVASGLFFGFHVLLGWRISQRVGIEPPIGSLIQMLNGGLALFCLFLAIASWQILKESVTSRLGQLVIGFAAAFYLLRGLAEFVVPPRFGPVIFGICVAIGAVYVLAWSRRRPGLPAGAAKAGPAPAA